MIYDPDMAQIEKLWRARLKNLREALRISVKPKGCEVRWSLDARQLSKVEGKWLHAQRVVDPGEPK